MKRIREVNGQRVALLEAQDVETLLICRGSYIPEQIYTEASIRNMTPNAEGFYEILDPARVEYIANLGFIPDYDYLASLSPEELNRLADKAIADKAKVSEIITKLCDYKEKLKRHERKTLEHATFLEPRTRDYLEDNVLNASLPGTQFRSMEEALLAQARNYANQIVKMAEAPVMVEGQSKVKRF